jgi:hypothetical protein
MDNVALEQEPEVNTLDMTAEDWITLEGTAVTFKDGQINIPAGRGADSKHVVYSKQKFKGPVKVEVVYRQATEVNECMRVLVFPNGQEDPAVNWARGIAGNRVQIGAGGWGSARDPFYIPADGRQVRKQNFLVKKESDKSGCFVKLPSNCSRAKEAVRYKEFATDGTRTEAECIGDDARKNAWNAHCKVTGAEVKWVALPIQSREDQTMVLEVWANQTATYTLNGQFVDNFPFNTGAGNKEGVIAMSACTEQNIKSVKVTRSGMYGLSTAECANNLRAAMVSETRLAHTFGSSFAGEATDCDGSEAVTPCDNPLCQGSKLGFSTPKVQRLSGYIMPNEDAEYEFSAYGAYGMELWLNNNKLIYNNNRTGQKATGTRQALKAGTGYRFQAFSLALTTEDVGCFVMVPTECTKNVVNFKRHWGPIGEWNRDYHGEARGSALSEETCLNRKRDFDGYCGIEDSEMNFKAAAAFGGEFKLEVKVGTTVTDAAAGTSKFEGTTYSPLTTKTRHFTVCTTKDCKEPKKVCQTKATETCECDTWANRAPEKWGLAKDSGSCCMRPTYDVKAGPWCYCKGGKDNKDIPDFAQCLPELASHKGRLDLVEGESEDSWAETDLVSMVEVEEAVEAPTTGVTGTTAENPVIDDLDCLDGKNAGSRENQLGNAINTANPTGAIPHNQNANRYIWTVPDHVNNNCVIRLRYNISTSDYPDWANDGTPLTTSSSNANLKNNKYVGPDGKDTTSPIMQDPYVGIGDDPQKTFLSLAVNTNQYGRTFQDRSYVFAIKSRPDGIAADAKIYNVNVRGKRGNIVQTYPAVEYDFVPNDLCTEVGDYVHFQWTGSDYNPQRNPNDAEGGGDSDDQKQARRADRTNLVELDLNGNSIKFPTSETRVNNEGPFPESKNQTGAGKRNGEVALGMNYPAGALGDWAKLGTQYEGMFWKGTTTKDQTGKDVITATEPDKDVIMNLAFIDQVKRMRNIGKRCLTLEELNAIKNQDERERNPGNCAKLNGAKTPYFDGGLVKLRKAGKFSYFSSRNNNFSNRNQAGCICVGQTKCKENRGCQVLIEDEHRQKMQGEQASTGKKKPETKKLLEVAEPEEVAEPKQAVCDADCVAALRAQVSALNEQVATLKSGL